MTTPSLEITKERQLAVTMAYLTYAGEKLTQPIGNAASVPESILKIINCAMPQLPILQDKTGQLDWRIIWGPTIYSLPLSTWQDNMMLVFQSISDPTQVVVATRGTNGVSILDWVEEDCRVLTKVDWSVPNGQSISGKPQISTATQTGLNALLNKMTPMTGLPGQGQSIELFLSQVTRSGPVTVTFTGHSLAGALCEALGLWFKQAQGQADSWDPKQQAAVKVISFAGATAGNTDFAAYFNHLFGPKCQRIHNTHDIVPHAWADQTLKQLPDLYLEGGITLPLHLKLAVDCAEAIAYDYQQVETSFPFTWPINPEANTYTKQMSYQHVEAYPAVLDVAYPAPIIAACQKKLSAE